VETLVLSLHVIVCIILVLVVLLQSGREGMGVIFGGGSSTMFGSAGAGGILAKLTTFVAIIFFATSLSYNMLTGVKPTRQDLIREISIDDPSAPVLPATPDTGQNNPIDMPLSR
jgi:preprotein translocase subunit SecG